MSNNFSRRQTLSLLKKVFALCLIIRRVSSVSRLDFPIWLTLYAGGAMMGMNLQKNSHHWRSLSSPRELRVQSSTRLKSRGVFVKCSLRFTRAFISFTWENKNSLLFSLYHSTARILHTHTFEFERVVGRQPSSSTASDWQNCSPYIKSFDSAHKIVGKKTSRWR